MAFDKVTLIHTNMNMSRHQKKILAQKTKRNSAEDLCS